MKDALGGYINSFSYFTLYLHVLGLEGFPEDLLSEEFPPPAYSFYFLDLICKIDLDSVHFVVNVIGSSWGLKLLVNSDFEGFKSVFLSNGLDYYGSDIVLNSSFFGGSINSAILSTGSSSLILDTSKTLELSGFCLFISVSDKGFVCETSAAFAFVWGEADFI